MFFSLGLVVNFLGTHEFSIFLIFVILSLFLKNADKKRKIKAVCEVQKHHLHSQKLLAQHPEYSILDRTDYIPGWTIVGHEPRSIGRRDPISYAQLENLLVPKSKTNSFYCAKSYA